MKLTIKKLNIPGRPWLIKRDHGTYKQHAHLHTREDAEKVRQLIDSNRYPCSHDYKIAMRRLLTEEEFKRLNKRPRYYNILRLRYFAEKTFEEIAHLINITWQHAVRVYGSALNSLQKILDERKKSS